MPLHIETPLIESRPLSTAARRSVWLKLEALQPPGSFKIRGIGAACEEYGKRGARRFVSSSGGNAGLAVAYAGRCVSIPVTVVVPETVAPSDGAVKLRVGAVVSAFFTVTVMLFVVELPAASTAVAISYSSPSVSKTP